MIVIDGEVMYLSYVWGLGWLRFVFCLVVVLRVARDANATTGSEEEQN